MAGRAVRLSCTVRSRDRACFSGAALLPLALLKGFLDFEAPACRAAPQLRPDLSGVHGWVLRRCFASDPAKCGVFECSRTPGGFLRARCRVLRSGRCSAAPPSPRERLLRHRPLPARPKPAGASLRSAPRAAPPLFGGLQSHRGKCKEIGRVQSTSAEGNAPAELEN